MTIMGRDAFLTKNNLFKPDFSCKKLDNKIQKSKTKLVNNI